MNTKLLNKIKKNWTIIEYTDPSDNQKIFRALYKNKQVGRAWISANDPQNYRQLILGIAYRISWDGAFNTWPDYLKMAQQDRLDKRLGATPIERAIKKAKTIWP